MKKEDKRWQQLFLFSLGIVVATTFIMQWLASDFLVGGTTVLHFFC